MTMRGPEVTAPDHDVESAPFWKAAAEGRLLLRRCLACGEAHYFPRSLCAVCLGETEWVEASGRGTVYSYSVIRTTSEPYAVAYVTLEEGPRMLTRLIAENEVRVTFVQTTEPDIRVPFFEVVT
jgi:uncharacterized OB-fold protein